jgi:hypothetical protein
LEEGEHIVIGKIGFTSLSAFNGSLLLAQRALRMVDGVFWWAARTPDGLATLSLARDGGTLLATAYGPGAGWVLDRADASIPAAANGKTRGVADLWSNMTG